MSKDNEQLAVYDDIKFQYRKFNYSTFKQKETVILRNTFEKARMGEGTSFEGYANMEFDEENDPAHEYPKFTVYRDFDRRNTYGLVYDITNIPTNVVGQYNKLIIYHYVSKMSFYGYVLYNSETKKSTNTFIIDHDDTDLFSHISYSFNVMGKHDLFKKLDEHNKMVDKLHGRAA